MHTDPQPALPILDDAEWELLETLQEHAVEPLGVAAEQAAVEEAARRTGFDAARMQAALSTLTSKEVLVGFGDGAVQITKLGRELIVARRL